MIPKLQITERGNLLSLTHHDPLEELRSIADSLGSTASSAADQAQLRARLDDWIATAEQRRGRARSLYHSLVECLPIHVTRKDREGRITFVNGPFCELVGKTSEELVGKTDYDLFPADLADKYRRDDLGVFTTGLPFHAIETNETDAGIVRYFEVWKVPVRNTSGEILESQAVFWDVTQREQNRIDLARERDLLRIARQEADDANRAKSVFLANMSHEIRTPLNGVLGITSLLINGVPAQDLHSYLNVVRDSGESLMSLVNDILDFSKLEAGRVRLEETEIDFQAILGSSLKPLALRAHQAGVELCLDIDPEIPPRLLADPLRLRQVLTNLVGNAIKFTREGEVVVRAVLLERDPQSVRLSIRVEDTGIGIPADKIEQVFEAFSQADNSTTRLYGGTGLGLAISSRLVEAMGGTLQCESEPAVGTVFHFAVNLPVADPSPPAADSPPTRGRLLIAEPHATTRAVLMRLAESLGVDVSSVATAEEAIARVQGQSAARAPWDFVVADAALRLGRVLGETFRSDNTNFIELVKAGAEQLDEVVGLEVSRLIKPITQRELLQELQRPMSTGGDAASTSAAKRSPENRSLRILVAEDSATNQLIVKLILARDQHQVTFVTTGREAIEASAAAEFDLILMDVQMPVLDGLDATREIRQREIGTGHRIPILAMTAGAMAEDQSECLNAGMDGYLTKPIREETLRAAIREISHTL